jgi:lipoyl synthase
MPNLPQSQMPQQIRVSVGTAIVLELLEGKLDAQPTTAYLMTYHAGKCVANCGFCPQARGSKSSGELLSRVTWPTFPTEKVLAALANASKAGKIGRICIQALNYPEVFSDLCWLVKEAKKACSVPISVSCQPQKKDDIERLDCAGADRLGIPLDAATEALFSSVKGEGAGGPYRWEKLFATLKEAIEVFGRGNVSTHLIVGLGESEREAVTTLQKFVDLGILPALFAFTPIRGTVLEKNPPPKVESYRRLQLARFLIVNGAANLRGMVFDSEGKIASFGLDAKALKDAIGSGVPFQTSGCPDCNRPFYNEKPSGPIYNYPKNLTPQELEEAKRQLAVQY